MNIGLFMDSFYPRVEGVTVCMDAIAREYVKLGHKAVVFVPEILESVPFEDLSLPYKVIRCKNSRRVPFLDYSLPRPKSTKGFYEKIVKENLDIVHLHSPFSVGAYGANFAKDFGIPAVATLHTKFDFDFMRALKIRFLANIGLKMIVKTFNKADLVTTMNPACEDIAVKQYKITSKVALVPNGTSLAPTSNTPGIITGLKGQYGIKYDEFVLISLGRICKLKNLDFTFKIVKELKQRNEKIKLILVGSGKDTKHYKKLTKKLDIENEVVFFGKITDAELKAALYSMADLHIFPSIYDTDGIVKAEAAACKTPTIFIENTTAASVICDNENGYLCKNDVKSFADKIVEIKNNPKLNKKVSENAQKTLVKRWDEIAKMFLELYEQLINKT